MLSGKVIGTASATVKHPTLDGWKLLIVRSDPHPVLAVDQLGAGTGDTVMITSDGLFTSELVGTKKTPIRWSVIGIIDEKEKQK
ncbi:MAG: EutN/CcmL family microcompartment protein [Planctomycetaceae bacterium]|jgi:ethanolamine utilization protein EutN|nr:EutN/CcmL family microcompartment protein [Planctomycetaceae bacterium]